MGYLVSFLGGALGFAIFDKSTESGTKSLNLVGIAAQMLIIYWVYKKLK